MNHPETETPQQTQPENHVHSAKHKKTSKRELIRQRSIYALPNSFTLAALFAAFFAITQSMHGRYESAAISVFIAMLLDGMDGRIARFTNSQSAFGEQLDSLADMVSFGVAPALIVYNWQLYSPTAAALMVGMIWLDRSYDGIFDQSSIWVLLLTLFAGLSMVVQIPFWSFKEIKLRHRISFPRMIGMLMLIVLLVLQPALILFLAFFAYSLSGYVMWAWQKWQSGKTRLD